MSLELDYRRSENKDGFPSEFVHPKIKEGYDWLAQYAKAFWGQASSNSGAYSFVNDKARFDMNRKYAEGLYPVEDFQNMLNNGDEEGDMTFANYDYSVETPLPTVIGRLVGKIHNTPFKPQAKMLDSQSLLEEDAELKRIYLNMELREEIEKAKKVLRSQGKKPKVKENISVPKEDLPKDEREFRVFKDVKYKPARAAASEALIRHFRQSTNDERLSLKVIRDLLNCKVAGKRVWLDTSTHEVKQRWVDPMNLVTSWVKEDDFSDCKVAGEVIYPTIDDIREEAPYISEEELFNLAKHFAGDYSNPDWMFGDDYFDDEVYEDAYKNFTIPVLDTELKSTDVYEKRKKKSRNGGYYYQTIGPNFEKPKRPRLKEEYKKKTIRSVYKFKYIIDSDYIYDYGRKENIIRPDRYGKKQDPLFTFKLYAPNLYNMKNKGLTERARPHAKQLILIQMKMQQFISNAAPAGHAFNIDAIIGALKGMGMGGMKPVDMSKMRKEVGDIFFKATNEVGEDITGGREVIQDLPNGLDQSLEILGSAYNRELTRMYETLGINNAAGRATPEKDMLNGQEEMALAATTDSLKELMFAFHDIQKRTYESALLYYKKIIRKSAQGRKKLELSIGEENIKMIDLSDLTNAEIGIYIKMLPDGKQLEIFRKYLAIEIERDNISSADAMWVEKYAEEDIDKATMLLEHKRDLYREEKMQKEQATTQFRIQERQAEQQAKAESTKASEQAKAQGEMAVLEKEYSLKEQFSIGENERDKEKLAVEWSFRKDAILLDRKLDEGVDVDDNDEGITNQAGNVNPDIKTTKPSGKPRTTP